MAVRFSDWRWLLAFASLLVLVGLVGATVANGVQAHQACAPTFDEAVHVLPAAQAADDLRHLDFASFLRHSYDQGSSTFSRGRRCRRGFLSALRLRALGKRGYNARFESESGFSTLITVKCSPTYDQDGIAQYPFFHSWLISLFFLLASPGLTVGRVANVAFVCLSVLLAFFLAGELSPRKDLW